MGGRRPLHPGPELFCMFFPRMDLFFIFNALFARCASNEAPAARASREEKTRSNTIGEYIVRLVMKHTPFGFLSLPSKNAMALDFPSG